MQLLVGQAALRGDIQRYARRFSCIELGTEVGQLPRRQRLEGWRSGLSPSFRFSLRMPLALGTLRWEDEGKRVVYVLRAAEALAVDFVVLRTPPEVTPTTRNRDRLAACADRLRADGRRVAWDARGLWEDEDAEALAHKLDLVLVRDATRRPLPPGPVAYVRALAAGRGAHFRESGAERIAEALADRELGWVVIEGAGAVAGARRLQDLVLGTTADPLDELDRLLDEADPAEFAEVYDEGEEDA